MRIFSDRCSSIRYNEKDGKRVRCRAERNHMGAHTWWRGRRSNPRRWTRWSKTDDATSPIRILNMRQKED